MITLEQKKYLTDVEAAEVIGVKPSTLRKWRLFDGRGPRWQRRGTKLVRYEMGDLLRWLDSQAVGGQR